MIKLLTLIAAIHMVYGMGRDLLKAIFTPKKFMRDNKLNDNDENSGIGFIDFN